jgi:hypothetical protein
MRLVVLAVLLVHSWYPRSCCGGNDCRPVPCEEISRTDAGDYIWRHAQRAVTFSRTVVKPSQDEECHVCVEDEVVSFIGVCLFLAPRV